MLTPGDLARLHAFELARADMLGERPLEPDQLLALAAHMEALAEADPRWVDTLVAQADAADARHTSTRHAPHMGARRVL